MKTKKRSYHSKVGTGQDFLDPIGNFKIYAGCRDGRPVSDRPGQPFFYRRFLFTVQCVQWKIFKREGGKGEVLKFVTPYGVLRKNAEKFLRFLKNDSILKPFQVKFWFEEPVLSSAKHAQNKREKNRRSQAKLLDVLLSNIMRKAKKSIF